MVKQFPEDANAYFQQGSIYERQKKYTEAERAFRKALDIEKDNPAVLKRFSESRKAQDKSL